MGFVDNISDFGSVAIVGLEKNTGKTECLNYLLNKIRTSERQFALTSIGIDGESRDQVSQTRKPEIEIPEGVVFVTSEKHFHEKRLTAQVLDVCDDRTALGRLIVAQAISPGKVVLSGPSDTAGLKRMLGHLTSFGVRTTLVDGALSRLSLASPTVTEAMILATGAAVSGNISELVRRTRYVCELIGLEQVDEALQCRLEEEQQGLWAITADQEVKDLGLSSAFLLANSDADVFKYGFRLYVAGAVGDSLLNYLKAQRQPVELIVRDFTRIFATPEVYYAFLRSAGSVRVLHRSRLLAVTVNPHSAGGSRLDSLRLQQALEESLKIPVYDVKMME